jgi:hypothetical protein
MNLDAPPRWRVSCTRQQESVGVDADVPAADGRQGDWALRVILHKELCSNRFSAIVRPDISHQT